MGRARRGSIRPGRARPVSIDALFLPEVSDLALDRGCCALGRLAHWWVRPEALHRAGIDSVPPHGDLRSGEFVVLLRRNGASPVLERGLALPLRWASGPSHDPRLPAELRRLADEVLERWRDSGTASSKASLWLGEACPDLRDVRLTVESAGVILAAALRATERGFEFDPRVSATASLSERGVGTVEGLEAKLEIAGKLGLRTIFVARGQRPPPLLPNAIHLGTAPEICEVPDLGVEQQLESVVLALDAPPAKGAVEARCEWYHRHRHAAGDRTRAGEFFCDAIAHELAQAAIERMASTDPLKRGMRTMISIATGSWESTAFTAHVLRPSRILLLHDTGARGVDYKEQTLRALQRQGACHGAFASVECAPWASAGTVEFEMLLESADERLRSIAERADADACIDLTGGTTLMKLALYQVAIRRGMHCTVTDSMDHAKGRTDVRTLRVISIPHGDGW